MLWNAAQPGPAAVVLAEALAVTGITHGRASALARSIAELRADAVREAQREV